MDWKGKKHDDFSEAKKQKARCAVRLRADFASKIGHNTARLLSRTVLSLDVKVSAHNKSKGPLIILPDSGGDLLRRELALAFSNLGFQVLRPRPEALSDAADRHYLPRLLEKRPRLFFSVNMQGLLRHDAPSKWLNSAGTPVLAWFVDNPWHILSAMRNPGWKEFYLAATDHTFLKALEEAGARRLLHLPLAASRDYMRAGDCVGASSTALGRIVFVGRAAFPGREGFFQGQELPQAALDKAFALLDKGFYRPEDRPDFQWWVCELGLSDLQREFWPGKKARRPGLGADLCNAGWRRACLRAAAKTGRLSIFGDTAWDMELGRAAGYELRGPVDYYGSLPGIYRAAAFSLNLNSLLLPAGLSQRAFDVWAAGGFCLMDYSPGLSLFPPELVEEICFHAPEELPELAARLEAEPARRERLRRSWQQHILTEHSYERRLKDALKFVGLTV